MKSEKHNQIIEIWDNYIKSNKKVFDTKGNELPNIDESRKNSIIELKKFINQFVNGEINIFEFKTNIDSFNKRNNLWGFTATKGQMFFNQLVKSSETKIEKITQLLKQCIIEPKNLNIALEKIELLEKYCIEIFRKLKTKEKYQTQVLFVISYHIFGKSMIMKSGQFYTHL